MPLEVLSAASEAVAGMYRRLTSESGIDVASLSLPLSASICFCSAVIAVLHDARPGSNTYQIEDWNSCACWSPFVHSRRMRSDCDW